MNASRAVPREIADFFRKIEFNTDILGPEFSVTQAEVDTFTKLVDDDNPLHKRGQNKLGDDAVVPGYMLQALITRYTPVKIPNELGGKILTLAMTNAAFRMPLFVGITTRMRCRLVELPKWTPLGIRAKIDFAAVVDEVDVARGSVTPSYV